jgi:hypothetical protein
MSVASQKPKIAEYQSTELLILPDGRVLVHNLTPSFAVLLSELNPDCEQITPRITHHASRTDELPD